MKIGSWVENKFCTLKEKKERILELISWPTNNSYEERESLVVEGDHNGFFSRWGSKPEDLGSLQSKSGTSIIIYMVILWAAALESVYDPYLFKGATAMMYRSYFWFTSHIRIWVSVMGSLWSVVMGNWATLLENTFWKCNESITYSLCGFVPNGHKVDQKLT